MTPTPRSDIPTPRPLSRLRFALTLLGLALSTVVSLAAPPPVMDRILVRPRPGVAEDRIQDLFKTEGAQEIGRLSRINVRILRVPAERQAKVLAALTRNPHIDFAEADQAVAPDLTPNDPYLGSEWHLAKTHTPAAWDLQVGSPGITIAILDTGVDGSHPDLAPVLLPGWNTYDNNDNTADVYGHGTAVAGTAAAVGNNGIGVAGVAWGCRILPLRISDTSGYGYSSTISAALTWAADHGARVANISYRLDYSSTVTAAARYFRNQGGVVTMSAGNSALFYDTGDNPEIVVVSATDSADRIASWSNTGSNVDLAAPGVSILTTSRGGGFGSWSGTSFSAPFVAGVAALVLSANPALSGSQVVEVLKASTDDLGNSGYDTTFGWGRVNSEQAVLLAAGSNPPPTDSTPPIIAFLTPVPGDLLSGVTTIQVSATDNVGVASVTLRLNGTPVATDTGAPFEFSWDTTEYPNGDYFLEAVASDAAGNAANDHVAVTVANVLDVTAPTVAITSPQDGERVARNVTLSAEAWDNLAVVRVEFYVDGDLVGTSTSAPYFTKWNSRKAKSGLHAIECLAYDAAGNVGTSPTVTVTK